MQKEIETILKANGYTFCDGYSTVSNIYETVFRNGNKDYIMKEVTHLDKIAVADGHIEIHDIPF